MEMGKAKANPFTKKHPHQIHRISLRNTSTHSKPQYTKTTVIETKKGENLGLKLRDV